MAMCQRLAVLRRRGGVWLVAFVCFSGWINGAASLEDGYGTRGGGRLGQRGRLP